ncbi:MAG TPA: 3-dehydroquinate synthase, partial [Candidatus Limnocylindrales bacterium]|nr:3-dehydroquinate synthase [Candidatus Limnocylindrales bacterium]
MQIVKVSLGNRSYDIKIGTGLLARVGRECSRLALNRGCTIISDRNVAPRYAKAVQDALTKAGFAAGLITIPAGETAKSLKTLAACYGLLATQRLERKSFIVALGGGV